MSDFEVAAVQIGMVAALEIAEVIARALALTGAPVVWDPVLRATTGTPLFRDDPVAALELLAPHLTLFTPNAVEAWTEALKYGQQLNDRLLTSDWTQIDWRGLGRMPPTKSLTSDEIKNALGGSQRVPQSDDEACVKTLRRHSVFAEYFPAGHVPFLMNVLTHPQMLQLQRMCLGSDEIYFDHNQLLTRLPGYPGGAWHSHRIGGGADNCGVASLSEYQAQPNFNLTLCYPQGFEAGDDGGLKIIRGSHLFRDPAGCRAADDEEMQGGWLAARVHPTTSEPRQIEYRSPPPGTIVCCL